MRSASVRLERSPSPKYPASFWVPVVLLLAFVSLAGVAYGSDVVLFAKPGQHSSVLSAIKTGCEFYGLQLETFAASESMAQRDILTLIENIHPEAVVATSEFISDVEFRTALAKVTTRNGNFSPLLVVDVDSTTDPLSLQDLSRGAISGCLKERRAGESGTFEVGSLPPVTLNLTEQVFQIHLQSADTFVGGLTDTLQEIIRLSPGVGIPGKPVFVHVRDREREIFFLSRFLVTGPIYWMRPSLDRSRLFEILPVLMFLRYAGGDRCWTNPGCYANLTIDDPWLTEPYGHLNYGALLEEMQKVNFHTTIAFVPWNYDRSEPAVVALFRDHPGRYSLCIHGNNHDHREFNLAASREIQEADILQGLARMEMFTRLTGLSYDRVMVFPHTIGTADSLLLLKKYAFLGTVNQDNVPLGEERPLSGPVNLRSVSMDYQNFPSLSRAGISGVKGSEADIAIEMFLGNPILLYGHHDIFRKGISRFDRLAETINRLEPAVQWVGLEAVMRHLYLSRKREDGGIDVLAFCRSIELENAANGERTFHILMPESFSFAIRRSAVDGVGHPYEKTPEGIQLSLDVPAGAKRVIDIDYEQLWDLGSVDVSKNNTRINRLRALSDFRDIDLSSSAVGRFIIAFYYGTGYDRAGTLWRILLGLSVLVFIGAGARYVLRGWRRRHARMVSPRRDS